MLHHLSPLAIFEILRQTWHHMAKLTINTDAMSNSNHRARKQRMIGDANRLPLRDLGLKLLSEHTRGREPADQLKSSFRQTISTTLVNDYGSNDVPKAASDQRATVNTWQHIAAIAHPRAVGRASYTSGRTDGFTLLGG